MSYFYNINFKKVFLVSLAIAVFQGVLMSTAASSLFNLFWKDSGAGLAGAIAGGIFFLIINPILLLLLVAVTVKVLIKERHWRYALSIYFISAAMIFVWFVAVDWGLDTYIGNQLVPPTLKCSLELDDHKQDFCYLYAARHRLDEVYCEKIKDTPPTERRFGTTKDECYMELVYMKNSPEICTYHSDEKVCLQKYYTSVIGERAYASGRYEMLCEKAPDPVQCKVDIQRIYTK